MNEREFKDALFGRISGVAGAFSSPRRMEIVDVLAQGEHAVEAIARETEQSVANASRHLQVLKRANLVATRRSGQQVFYRLADPLVLGCHRALRELAEARMAEVGRIIDGFFEEDGGPRPVGREALLTRVREGDVVVLDVRPGEEFAAGHIAGALSIPLRDLERRLAELPPGRPVVAYCRGPYCVLAAEAVRLLRAQGFDAARLADGFPEWRDAGMPIAPPRDQEFHQ